ATSWKTTATSTGRIHSEICRSCSRTCATCNTHPEAPQRDSVATRSIDARRASARRARVKAAMKLTKLRAGYVGVDLRGGDVGVPEHRLHRAQIRAALEEVGREGVTQAMRAHLGKAEGKRPPPEELPEALAGHCAA